jgi:hypothetical protein
MSQENVQIVTAMAETVGNPTEIGTEVFTKKLLEELHSKNLWRKLESLAESLHVDVQHLKIFLDKTSGILRRPGKDDGIFFYCWEERFKREGDKTEKKKVGKQRPAIKEEERYAMALLHMIYSNLHRALKTYGLEISQRDNEAFNNFTVALDRLESGLVLFSAKSSATIEKLPKL